MVTLEDSVEINKPPEVLFEWLHHFVENYQSWHPDHVMAKWLKGDNFREGAILYAEEYIGDKLEKLSFKITKNVPNKVIEYKVLFPESIICSGGSFIIEPRNNGSIFTATLSFRFGSVLSKLYSS